MTSRAIWLWPPFDFFTHQMRQEPLFEDIGGYFGNAAGRIDERAQLNFALQEGILKFMAHSASLFAVAPDETVVVPQQVGIGQNFLL